MRERDLSRRGFGEPFFEDLMAPLGSLLGQGEGTRVWSPPVNIEETDEAYQVSAELPGLRKEEVEITVENNVLTICGERKWELEEGAKNRQMHRMERGYGRFSRSFALPRRVDQDKVEARFHDGVLEVTIPKAEGSRPRRIDIS